MNCFSSRICEHSFCGVMNQPRLMNRPTRASHGSLLRYRSTASRRNVQCPEVIHYSGYISMGKHDYETRQKKRRPDRALQCPSLFGSLRAPLALRHRRVRGRSPRGDFPALDRGRNRVFLLEEMECDQFYLLQTRTKRSDSLRSPKCCYCGQF